MTKHLIYTVKVIALTLILVACTKEEPLLDKSRFISLLVDMHMADGTFSVVGSDLPDKDKKVYTYYNWIYEKYGITNTEFDSCINYYSAKPQLFIEIYEGVTDSLNKILTVQNLYIQELKSNDSLNYITYTDTIILHAEKPEYTYEVDSLKPGLYNFGTTVKLDTADNGRNNRILSMFISANNKDTLNVRNLYISRDTLEHHYTWSQYIDSSYNKLVVVILKSDKVSEVKERKARVWNTVLYKPYISKKREEQLQATLRGVKQQQARAKSKENKTLDKVKVPADPKKKR
ncbi:DUF4296 domain-containing protein [Porphyromonadaceae bacterium OttesenSCG-928-L07]|nr:DUF4296 domain-containing protein [Porphyromonadaceae bacterium OttesenSCG-928-L07]MDL2251626.1 DUF4296 domain-containing protein [Odoribacter sp. OttesenSCG-928-J03]MDL2331228.1 DUF4296 domain-containing protein [Odoribacter sp. OttesenSCG-928-A06]